MGSNAGATLEEQLPAGIAKGEVEKGFALKAVLVRGKREGLDLQVLSVLRHLHRVLVPVHRLPTRENFQFF